MKKIIILLLLLTFNVINSDILDSQIINKERQSTMFSYVEHEIERQKLKAIAEIIANIEHEAEIEIPSYVDIKYIKYMYDKSIELNLPIRYVFRLINRESRFKAKALSRVGAQGFMQIMPKTRALYVNRLNLKDCSMDENLKNITIGLHMLDELNNIFKHKNNRWELVLASYNAGIGNVKKYNGVPPIRETRDYITYILKKRKS